MTWETAKPDNLSLESGSLGKEAIREARSYATRLYAEIAVRIVAFACDLLLTLFAMVVVDDHVLTPLGLSETLGRSAWVAFLLVYFAASWVGPLQATPMQCVPCEWKSCGLSPRTKLTAFRSKPRSASVRLLSELRGGHREYRPPVRQGGPPSGAPAPHPQRPPHPP